MVTLNLIAQKVILKLSNPVQILYRPSEIYHHKRKKTSQSPMLATHLCFVNLMNLMLTFSLSSATAIIGWPCLAFVQSNIIVKILSNSGLILWVTS